MQWTRNQICATFPFCIHNFCQNPSSLFLPLLASFSCTVNITVCFNLLSVTAPPCVLSSYFVLSFFFSSSFPSSSISGNHRIISLVLWRETIVKYGVNFLDYCTDIGIMNEWMSELFHLEMYFMKIKLWKGTKFDFFIHFICHAVLNTSN